MKANTIMNANVNMNNQNTFEKSKAVRYSISSIIKKIDNQQIRFDHPAQRESDQWSNKMKGNLISDILQDNPIPAIILAEQNINGNQIIWNIDGKQRCTNVYSFTKGMYKIPKGIRRSVIQYQRNVKDENGCIVKDEDGHPMVEWVEFNIIGKYYSQLPEELQDKIMDYNFDAVLYLNCSSEDLVYHIARYNDGRPMNKSQKGIINLGEDFATEVKRLSNHPFFVDFGSYGKNGRANGNIDRVICETIMTTNYLDNWKANHEEVCKYIKNNATEDDFDNVNDTLTRLEDIIDGQTECLFTVKESAIWFTIFNKFKALGYDDERFQDFLVYFIENNMKEQEINGMTYCDLEGGTSRGVNRKSTKDKKCVSNKIELLTVIMNNYFGESEFRAAV